MLAAQASSEAAAGALKKAVGGSNGVPHQIVVMDNGSAFVNLKGRKPTVFQQVCSELGITHDCLKGIYKVQSCSKLIWQD